MRTVALRMRSSQGWSSLVLRVAFALSNGNPWKVYMPSSALAEWQKNTREAAAAA
jgi:hypothetical protein